MSNKLDDKNTLISNIKSDLESHIEKLIEIDPLFPAMIHARATLRGMPLLGDHLSSEHWPSMNSKNITLDKASFLLSVYSILLGVINEALSPADERKRENFTKKSVDLVNFYSENIQLNALDICYSASITAVAAEAFYADASYKIADIIISSVSRIQDEFILNNFYEEIGEALNGMSLKKMSTVSLFPQGMPAHIDKIYNEKFIKNINILSKDYQSKSPDISDAINKVKVYFERNIRNTDGEVLPSRKIAYENTVEIIDKLGREGLVEGVASILNHDENNEHLTIGLLGHWGTGKTRVLDLLKRRLKQSQPDMDKKKSTRMNNKSRQDKFIFGEFNAWEYENAENSQAAMAHEIISSLTTCQRISDIKSTDHFILKLKKCLSNIFIVTFWELIRFLFSLNYIILKYPYRFTMLLVWITSFLFVLFKTKIHSKTIGQFINDYDGLDIGDGALIGALLLALWRIPKDLKVVLAQPYTKELLTYLKLPSYVKQIGKISEMRQDIKTMANIRLGTTLEQNKYRLFKLFPRRRLLFVVDDLDRCSPEGIVKTFEAIRLILDLPQVTVVIAVDQRIALASLALHYEKLTKHHQLSDSSAIARDYLGKMIQLPIIINDCDSSNLTDYLSHLWHDDESGEELPKWKQLLKDVETPEVTDEESSQSQNEYRFEDLHEFQSNKKLLSKNEIAQQINSRTFFEPKFEVKVKRFGLSEGQKAAFAYWSDKLGLRNARQLKRLYNSYNLIRHVSNEEDLAVHLHEEKFSYGLLVTLLITEYFSGISDNNLRTNAAKLLRVKIVPDEIQKNHRSLLRRAIVIIEASAEERDQFEHVPSEYKYTAMFDFIGLFTLPSISD